MISANELRLGGPLAEVAATAGRVGSGLVPLEVVPGLGADAVDSLIGGRDDDRAGLLLRLAGGLSEGRGDGLGEFPLGRDKLSALDSVRGALGAAVRKSSSAFLFGVTRAGRGAGFDDEDPGASPVIDPRISAIPIVKVVNPNALDSLDLDDFVIPPRPHTMCWREGIG